MVRGDQAQINGETRFISPGCVNVFRAGGRGPYRFEAAVGDVDVRVRARGTLWNFFPSDSEFPPDPGSAKVNFFGGAVACWRTPGAPFFLFGSATQQRASAKA